MTIKEAIHKMEFMKMGYQKLLEQKVKNGTVLRDDIEGYWEANTPLTEIYQAHIDACGMAIIALKKLEETGA